MLSKYYFRTPPSMMDETLDWRACETCMLKS